MPAVRHFFTRKSSLGCSEKKSECSLSACNHGSKITYRNGGEPDQEDLDACPVLKARPLHGARPGSPTLGGPLVSKFTRSISVVP